MQTMDQHLKELYQSGMVTYDDAVGKAMSPEEFKAMVSSGQVKK